MTAKPSTTTQTPPTRRNIGLGVGLGFSALVGALIVVGVTSPPVVPPQDNIRVHGAADLPLWMCTDAPAWIEGAFFDQEYLGLNFPLPLRGPCASTCRDSHTRSFECMAGFISIIPATQLLSPTHVGETTLWTRVDGSISHGIIQLPNTKPDKAELILAHELTHSRGLDHVRSSYGGRLSLGSFPGHLMYRDTSRLGSDLRGIP